MAREGESNLCLVESLIKFLLRYTRAFPLRYRILLKDRAIMLTHGEMAGLRVSVFCINKFSILLVCKHRRRIVSHDHLAPGDSGGLLQDT